MFKKNKMFEEVDQLLNKIRLDNEVNSYLNKGILPSYYSNSYEIAKEEKFPDPFIPEIKLNNYPVHFHSLDTLEFKIYLMREREKQQKKDDCPICFTKLESTNYVNPGCGHKLCMPCFIENAKKNKQTGNQCCLCRRTMWD